MTRHVAWLGGAVALGLMTMLPAFADEPQKGGTITIAIAGDPEHFDPPDHINIGALTIRMVHEGLVRFKPFSDQAEIEPSLAESWDVSEDGKTWTFTLRDGVTFHDGTPFTSAAVKHYFDRVMTGEMTNKGSPLFRGLVESYQAPDEQTIVFTLSQPHSYFLHRLAHEASFFNSPEAERVHGEDFIFNPVGTGPFRFVEFVPGQHVILERNAAYWRGEPYLDQVIQKPVREVGTRLLQLEAGQLHVAPLLSEEMIPRLEESPDLESVVTLSNRAFRISLNTTKKPFDDIRVRQALNYAINRDELTEFLFGGLAVAIPGGLSPKTAGFADIEPYPYDPDRARELLEQAEYGDGFEFTLTLHGAGTIMPKDLPLAETIQQYLQAIGVTMNLQTMEWAAMRHEGRQPREENKLEASFEQWPPSTGEASWVFTATAHTNAVPPNGVNRAFYSSPVFDHLLATSMAQRDNAMRDEFLRGAQLVLREDAPWVFLLTPSVVAGKRSNVQNFVFDPVGGVSTWANEQTWLRQ